MGLEQAKAEMATIARRLEEQYRDILEGYGVNLVPLHRQVVARVELALWVLLGIVASALLIITSYSVTQRTHEIGIRMTLGARPGDVLRLILGHGAILAAMGVAVGLIGALLLTRVMSSLLYEVSATDPATFAVISLLLITVGLLASYIPARRASKVDPMVALRYE